MSFGKLSRISTFAHKNAFTLFGGIELMIFILRLESVKRPKASSRQYLYLDSQNTRYIQKSSQEHLSQGWWYEAQTSDFTFRYVVNFLIYIANKNNIALSIQSAGVFSSNARKAFD